MLVRFSDRIHGLGLGADDYLPKPFNPDELLARIEAIRRWFIPSQSRKTKEKVSIGEVTIDFKKHRVEVNGKEIHLTRIEWVLLSELTQNSGWLLSYDDLLTRILGSEYRDDVHLLRTWISRLRSKIELDPTNPTLFRTVPKTGYIVDQPVVEE